MIFIVATTLADAIDYAIEHGIDPRDYRGLSLLSRARTRGRMFTTSDEFVVLPISGTPEQRRGLAAAIAPCGAPTWVLNRIANGA